MFKTMTKTLALAVSLLLGFGGSALAEYPERPLTVIVPYGPGGMSDLTARSLANSLQTIINQSIGVVNRAGGGGVVGGHTVAQSRPSYTYGLLAPVGSMPEIFRPDAAGAFSSKDLLPVSRVAVNVTTLVVSNDFPAKNLKEFIEYCRKNPGVKYGHTGRGNATHLLGADLALLEKLDMQDVPYQGDAKVAAAILGGQLKVGVSTLPGVLAHIKAGSMRAIGIYVPERIKEIPDVQTFAEQGVQLRMPAAFNALFAPLNTPQEHLDLMDKAVAKAFEDPAFIESLNKIGSHPGYLNRADFMKELETYKKVANEFAEQFGLGTSK